MSVLDCPVRYGFEYTLLLLIKYGLEYVKFVELLAGGLPFPYILLDNFPIYDGYKSCIYSGDNVWMDSPYEPVVVLTILDRVALSNWGPNKTLLPNPPSSSKISFCKRERPCLVLAPNKLA